jgi:tRNA(fMet)-specific endonuclease VapC
MFFRGRPNVVDRFEAYLVEYDEINLSILTYYEIVSGLKHRDARKQLSSFLDFASYNNVLPLTQQSVTISADVDADLRAKGTPVDDIDLLIAGVAMANDLVLVTRNRKHFDRIVGLVVEDWSEK